MEGKKTQIELPEIEREVLNLCLFPEHFDTICEECQNTKNSKVVADAIKNLLDYKFLIAINSHSDHMKWMYDVDSMKDSQFVATSKGLEHLHY